LIGLRFAHHYDVAPAPLGHEDSPVIHFSGITDIGSSRPLGIEVLPWEAEPWVGYFNKCTNDPNAVTGVFSHPDPNAICVISGGQAFIVDVTDPQNWQALPPIPVMCIADVPEAGLIILCDYTNMTAYGRDGFAWRSKRLSYDGLRLASVNGTTIRGFAWSAPEGREIEVQVDAQTGAHVGGDSPDHRE